jgi:hypothetical protein
MQDLSSLTLTLCYLTPFLINWLQLSLPRPQTYVDHLFVLDVFNIPMRLLSLLIEAYWIPVLKGVTSFLADSI